LKNTPVERERGFPTASQALLTSQLSIYSPDLKLSKQQSQKPKSCIKPINEKNTP
jgi:hypothetical protein